MVGQSLSGGVTNKIVEFLTNNRGNYLEIGCFDGVTLCGIADKVKDKNCYGIDPFISDGHLGPDLGTNKFLEKQKSNLYENISGSSNISFFEMTTEEFLKTKDIESLDISVVFIDGAHIFDFVMVDVEAAFRAIGDKDGMVVIDDQHIPDVSLATAEFEKMLKARGKNVVSSGQISSGYSTANFYMISSS